jgi:endonuclease/exonuclease/phosphatase family metal-dependent hydrolase
MRHLTATALAVLLSACAAGHEMDVRAPVGACASAPNADVAWARPDYEGEQSRLDDWCSAAGEPVVRQFTSTQVPADAEVVREASLGGGPVAAGSGSFAAAGIDPIQTLTVATWNIEVGSGDLVGFLEEEIGYSCESAPSGNESRIPFVLLVQEAHRASHDIPAIPDGVSLPGAIGKSAVHESRADIVEIAERCDLSLFYAPSMRNGAEGDGETPEDRGNAILASIPLSEHAAVELPLETQRRVAVAALAHPPGREPIRVVSFHFDVAANLLRVITTGNSTRLRQGLGLARALDQLDEGDRQVATIIGGDVNSWSEKESVIRHLAEQFPESPAATAEGTRGSYPTDHIFLRTLDGSEVSLAQGSYRVVPDEYGSDHRGRVLTLSFAGE